MESDRCGSVQMIGRRRGTRRLSDKNPSAVRGLDDSEAQISEEDKQSDEIAHLEIVTHSTNPLLRRHLSVQFVFLGCMVQPMMTP